MNRSISLPILLLVLTFTCAASAAEVRGHYLEARTCQIYTGPCFANGEVGLAGKDALMAWNVTKGEYGGVDITGLNVVVVVRASDTLGFGGLNDPDSVDSMILVDQRATADQRQALVDFSRQRSGGAENNVVRILTEPISMEFDDVKLTGNLRAGSLVRLVTRKARPSDCVCSNESAYYPPLAKLQGFVPGVTTSGQVSARPLGTRWNIPDSRTAYIGTFAD